MKYFSQNVAGLFVGYLGLVRLPERFAKTLEKCYVRLWRQI